MIKGKSPQIIFAKIISLVFDPIIILSLTLPLLIINSTLEPFTKVFVMFAIFVFYIVAPFEILFFFYKKKWITDLEIEKRSQRIYVEFGTLMCWLAGLIFLLNKKDDHLLNSFICLFAVIVVCFLINLFTKVSLHLATATTAILLLSFSFSDYILLAALIVLPLLLWSRVYLKHHTIIQGLLGIAVPIAIVPLLLSLFA